MISLANEVLPLRRPPLRRGVVNLQQDKLLRRISSSRVKNRVCAAFLDEAESAARVDHSLTFRRP